MLALVFAKSQMRRCKLKQYLIYTVQPQILPLRLLALVIVNTAYTKKKKKTKPLLSNFLRLNCKGPSYRCLEVFWAKIKLAFTFITDSYVFLKPLCDAKLIGTQLYQIFLQSPCNTKQSMAFVQSKHETIFFMRVQAKPVSSRDSGTVEILLLIASFGSKCFFSHVALMLHSITLIP